MIIKTEQVEEETGRKEIPYLSEDTDKNIEFVLSLLILLKINSNFEKLF